VATPWTTRSLITMQIAVSPVHRPALRIPFGSVITQQVRVSSRHFRGPSVWHSVKSTPGSP
jgi:hypothetical protein